MFLVWAFLLGIGATQAFSGTSFVQRTATNHRWINAQCKDSINNIRNFKQGYKWNHGSSFMMSLSPELLDQLGGGLGGGRPLVGQRTLAVDYGLRRTGIAFSVGLAPRPVKTVKVNDSAAVRRRHYHSRKKRKFDSEEEQLEVEAQEEAEVEAAMSVEKEEVLQEVRRQVTLQRAQAVVVGVPLDRVGGETNQSLINRNFSQDLADLISPQVPVYLWDEAFTSYDAEARLRANGQGDTVGFQLDAVSACVLLEDYFDQGGFGAELVQPRPSETTPDSPTEGGGASPAPEPAQPDLPCAPTLPAAPAFEARHAQIASGKFKNAKKKSKKKKKRKKIIPVEDEFRFLI